VVYTRTAAVDARRLVEMPLEEAANWIDLHLPPPPDAEHLTGCGDPPARPSYLPSPPFETRPAPLTAPPTPELPLLPSRPFLPESHKQIPTAPAKMRSSPRWKNASNSSPPPARPTSPRKRFVESSSSNWPSRQPGHRSQPCSHSRELGVRVTRLNLSYMPVNFEQRKFKALFEDIAVPHRIVLYRVSHSPTYAFVDVNSDDAAHAIRSLRDLSFGRSKLRCMVATSRNPESPPPVQPVESPHRQRPPSIVSQPIGQPLRRPSPVTRTVSPPRPNLLSRHPSPVPELRSSRSYSSAFTNVCVLFNLPLDGPSRRGPAAHLLNGDEVIKFPQHDQSVLIPATRGSSAIDRFERLWDGYLLDGRRLEVVRVKRGSTARQTIEEHFGRLSSAPSDHASISQLSSTAPQRSRSRSLSPRRRRI